ncbi:MAG: ATP-binding protein [Pseudobutyrivibrio sp.]|nr:ATP-binding protein [Pseudobutyrivibrio sp.]
MYKMYLLNLSVSGIKNIEKEVSLSFYKKTLAEHLDSDKYRVKAIYGENGAGKSAIVTAVYLFKNLVLKRNYLAESSNQSKLAELINKKTGTFRYSCEFHVEGEGKSCVFKYGVVLKKDELGLFYIAKETLEQRRRINDDGSYETVYAIEEGELIELCCDKESSSLVARKTANLMKQSTLPALEFNTHVGMSEVLPATSQVIILALITTVHMENEDYHDAYLLWDKFLEDSQGLMSAEERDKLVSQLRMASGTDKALIHKDKLDQYIRDVGQLAEFVRIFKPDLREILVEKKINADIYECSLVLDYGSYQVSAEFESTGIKKLMRLYNSFELAAITTITFIDELDANLNDVYLCRLIEFFVNYGKGQLCFTTHNIGPMSILKNNKNSIDFLSSDNLLTSWTKNGNYTPDSLYKKGYIEHIPFNVEAIDFLRVFGGKQ